MLCVCVRGIRGEMREHKIGRKRNTQEEGVYFTSRIRITKCSIIRSHNRLSMKYEEGALYSHPLSSLTTRLMEYGECESS